MTHGASLESKISFLEEQDPVVTTISKKPVAPQVVDEAAALAATGEHRLEGIRQLIMRGMRLASFELSCAARLRSLTVLSLSNNSLRDLESFKPLVNLVEVNVNFNAITSLHGLVCPNLRRLYLSNNLIASTERLTVSYPKLQTLCLFKNMLPNLASALEPLRRNLLDLRELDLDGNPCSRSRGYKHRVIRCCPRLRELDGEELGQLDRDLSDLFFEEQRNKTAWDRMGDVGDGGETSTKRRRCRPATAPATTVSRRWARSKGNHSNRAARENAKLLEEDSEELGAELQGSLERGELMDFAGLPAGKTQLLRSDRLNNDPQARRPYLAQGVLADPCGSPRDAVESLRRRSLARSTEKRRRATVAAEQLLREGEGGTREEGKVPGEEKDIEERGRGGEGEGECEGTGEGEGERKGPGIGAREGKNEEEGEGEGERKGERKGETTAAAVEDDSARNEPTSRARRSPLDGRRGVHGSEGETEEGSLLTNPARHVRPQDEPPPTLPLPPPPLPPATDLDPSDPYSTISRKLLKLVETLQLELARDDENNNEDRRYQAGASLCGDLRQRSGRSARGGTLTTTATKDEDAFCSDKRPPNPRTRDSTMICDDGGGGGDNYPYSGATSREDLRRLRLENRNMHLLLVENRELKAQIREEAANAELVQTELRDKLGKVEGKLDEVTGELEAARGRLLLLPQPATATATATATEEAAISSRSRGSDSNNTIPTSELSSSPTIATMDSAFGTDVSVGDGGGGGDGTGRDGRSYNSRSAGSSRVTPLDWRRRPEKAVCPTMSSKNLCQNHVGATSGMVKTSKGMERGGERQGSLEEQRPDYTDDATHSDSDEELEELFRRNERTMREIRCDLKLLQSGSRQSYFDNISNDDDDDEDDKRQPQVHEKQQPRKAAGEEAETGVGEQLPSWKTPPQVMRLRGGYTTSQCRTGGSQIPGPTDVPQLHQSKVWERSGRCSSSDPPSVSELLLQLQHDDKAAVRRSEDGTRKEGGVGNNANYNNSPRRKWSVGRASGKEEWEAEDSTTGEAGGGGRAEGVGYADTKGGVVTLVASNARALLMS
ncbi:unnamed protein product [Ectocarpus fasciculatus]